MNDIVQTFTATSVDGVETRFSYHKGLDGVYGEFVPIAVQLVGDDLRHLVSLEQELALQRGVENLINNDVEEWNELEITAEWRKGCWKRLRQYQTEAWMVANCEDFTTENEKNEFRNDPPPGNGWMVEYGDGGEQALVDAIGEHIPLQSLLWVLDARWIKYKLNLLTFMLYSNECRAAVATENDELLKLLCLAAAEAAYNAWH
jgi:hypothetical protein